ncbi:MAG TPA: hypothetical protein DD761_15000 [Cyanobacteria bacterium UBA11691]|nr:hypothetical protein [Cyanobacteria bacterium UBA11691]
MAFRKAATTAEQNPINKADKARGHTDSMAIDKVCARVVWSIYLFPQSVINFVVHPHLCREV